MTELIYFDDHGTVQAPAQALYMPGPGAADGVFETIRIRHGQATLWDAHLKRLQRGLDCLALFPGEGFSDALTQRVTTRVGGIEDGVLRVVVVAVAAEAGYRRRKPAQILVSLQVREAPGFPQTHYRDGVDVVLCRQRLGDHPGLAGIKHLNRLEQIMATRELQRDAAEGLMLDSQGMLVEGTRTNVFMRDRDGWFTPDLARCGVQGTLRDALLQGLPDAGLMVSLRSIPETELESVVEMFLCNSVIGVWPIRRVQGRALQIGGGTRQAQRLASQILALEMT